jgi:hypothetical protein
MRKLVVFMICVGFSTWQLFAQTNEVIRIKAGQDPTTGFSPQGFYRFSAFCEGVAVFKDGGRTPARFNYHMLNEEMQFIAQNGDTLALADPFSLKYITMDSSLYYYSNGYLEVIVNNESLKLARRLRLNTKWEKIGAYGQASPSGSIRTPNKIILGNRGSNLSLNQDLLIQKEYTYYWLDKYNTVLKATKANLLKLLPPDKKNSIDDYVKKNGIDFRKEPDLKKILQYSLSVE